MARAASAAGVFLFLLFIGACAYRGLVDTDRHGIDEVGGALAEEGFAVVASPFPEGELLRPLVGDSFVVYVFDSVGDAREATESSASVRTLRFAFANPAPVIADLNVVITYRETLAQEVRGRLNAVLDNLRA